VGCCWPEKSRIRFLRLTFRRELKKRTLRRRNTRDSTIFLFFAPTGLFDPKAGYKLLVLISIYQGSRLEKRDDYFRGYFGHFLFERLFLRQPGQ